MAIVRTTSRETNTSGAPPASPATRGAARSAPRAPVRGLGSGRTVAPARTGNAGQFVNDTKTELRRVVWPSSADVKSGTIVTVGLLVFFALFISGLDYIAEHLLQVFFSP